MVFGRYICCSRPLADFVPFDGLMIDVESFSAASSSMVAVACLIFFGNSAVSFKDFNNWMFTGVLEEFRAHGLLCVLLTIALVVLEWKTQAKQKPNQVRLNNRNITFFLSEPKYNKPSRPNEQLYVHKKQITQKNTKI